MIVFVSMTSFTRAPLHPHGFHFSLNLLFRQGLAGLRTDLIEQLLEFGSGFATAQFEGEQVAERRGFQQPVGLRFVE